MRIISKISIVTGMALLGSFMFIGCGSSSSSSGSIATATTLSGTGEVVQLL